MITWHSSEIDGYSHISHIDVANLREWWKVLILVFSNLFAIPAIIYGFIMGFYVWGMSILIAMLISMGYHLCQTTDFCIFGMSLYTWQETDHISAASILGMSILLFFLYRPHRKKKYISSSNMGPESSLEYDNILNKKDKAKICFNCRGVDPVMAYDWQSVSVIYLYIFIIIVTILTLPLTTQSFVIVIIFGVLAALFKILVIEEGDPSYLEKRFHLPSLITGIVLIVISLVFYFIDGYMIYWLFHGLWHVFSFVGFLFLLMGVSKDLPGWFNFIDVLKYLWKKIKLFFMIMCCCKCRKKKDNNKLPLDIYEIPDENQRHFVYNVTRKKHEII